jgi:hypothetical protein
MNWPVHPPVCSSEGYIPFPSLWWPHTLGFLKRQKKKKKTHTHKTTTTTKKKNNLTNKRK